ncbi:MAG: hypothetical protein ABSH47_25685 [Bryobacteraceae bacterium]|jgi:hypothetical protein
MILAEFTPEVMPSMSRMAPEGHLEAWAGMGYRISVLDPSGPINCGSDINAVMTEYRKSGPVHVDLLLEAQEFAETLLKQDTCGRGLDHAHICSVQMAQLVPGSAVDPFRTVQTERRNRKVPSRGCVSRLRRFESLPARVPRALVGQPAFLHAGAV